MSMQKNGKDIKLSKTPDLTALSTKRKVSKMMFLKAIGNLSNILYIRFLALKYQVSMNAGKASKSTIHFPLHPTKSYISNIG